MAEAKLDITIGEDVFTFWPDRITGEIARQARNEAGLSPAAAWAQFRAGDGDIDTIQVLVWAAERLAGKTSSFKSVESRWPTFKAMPSISFDFDVVDDPETLDPET